MTLYAPIRKAIEAGHWAQCKFCRRAAPLRSWWESKERTHNCASATLVEANGFCTDCQTFST